MYTKNYDQNMCGSWDMVHDGGTDWWTDGQKRWHIEPGVPPKNQNFENTKKSSRENKLSLAHLYLWLLCVQLGKHHWCLTGNFRPYFDFF